MTFVLNKKGLVGGLRTVHLTETGDDANFRVCVGASTAAVRAVPVPHSGRRRAAAFAAGTRAPRIPGRPAFEEKNN